MVIYQQAQAQQLVIHKLYETGLKFEEICEYQTREIYSL